MRIVFEVTGEIPGLANEGDHLAIYFDGRDHPVVRYTMHEAEAMRDVRPATDCLTPIEPENAKLNLIRELIGPPASPSEDAVPPLEVVR